jgi:peroxin-6
VIFAFQVLQALTRKFRLTSDVDLAALADRLPPQTTGADSYGLCADAWLLALRRRIAELTACGRISANSDNDEAYDLDDVEVDVSMDDFGKALGHFAPSLTLQDLDKYDAIQDQYAPDREKKAKTGGRFPPLDALYRKGKGDR